MTLRNIRSSVLLLGLFTLAACSDDKPSQTQFVPANEPKTAAAEVPPAPTPPPAAAVESNHTEIHWSYAGPGAPEHWSELKSEFATCATGTHQSPIDISGVTVAEQPELKVAYKDAPLTVANNGHTIQVSYPAGSALSIDGKDYPLVQFHFHSPSEHTLGGKTSAMVAHLVHKSAEGELAVIESRLDVGSDHELINKLWQHLPAAGQQIDSPETIVNAKDLLPDNLSRYFSYDGSLTTPPCSEGVKWFVLAETSQVGRTQVDAFLNLFPVSARPVQPVNGRSVVANN